MHSVQSSRLYVRRLLHCTTEDCTAPILITLHTTVVQYRLQLGQWLLACRHGDYIGTFLVDH